MEDRRLELIKILLKYIIEKNRQEENFINYINENTSLFNIDISLIENISFYDIVPDEEKAEEVFEFLNRRDLNIDKLIDEFCKKYKI